LLALGLASNAPNFLEFVFSCYDPSGVVTRL
jgi:hypothetical protein